MASIDQLQLPDGSSYNISVPYVVGTGSTAGAWFGELDGLTEYYDGLIILYKIPVEGASTTTLNINGLGAKTCYLNHTTKLTTHYPANQPILLTYSTSQNSGCWEALDNYDSNSNTVGEYAGGCKAGAFGMARYSLIMQTVSNGNDVQWESVVKESSTGTSKTKNTNGFLLNSPILYQDGATYTSGQVCGYSNAWLTRTADSRYSANVSNSWSATGRPFFLKGTIGNDNKFYLADTTWWSDAYPTTNDGFYYIYIGQMYNAYSFTLHDKHPIFYFDTTLHIFDPSVENLGITKPNLTNSEPYLYRQSGGSLNVPNVDIGNYETNTIVGGTVAWHQEVQNGDFATSARWSRYNPNKISVSFADGIASTTVTEAGSGGYNYGLTTSIPKTIIGHKYLLHLKGRMSIATTYMSMDFDNGRRDLINLKNPTAQTPANTWEDFWGVTQATQGNKNTLIIEPTTVTGSLSVDDTIEYTNIFIVDLTIVLGATIADFVFSKEQETPGSGILWLKSYGFFTKDYYDYNTGSLESVKTSAHKTIGFNQFDKSKAVVASRFSSSGIQSANAIYTRSDWIKVVPNTVYYFKDVTGGSDFGGVWWFDENKNFISAVSFSGASPKSGTATSPANAYYVGANFRTEYVDSACINLHCDGERDGEYEAYSEHTYALDSDLELRGLTKLVDGKLVYDGDTYESDGTVTRKYGYVDLGSLTWGYSGGVFICSNDLGVKARGEDFKCIRYINSGTKQASNMEDKTLQLLTTNYNNIWVKDSAYSDADTFKASLNGVYLVYELATSTTETADAFQNPQLVNDWGTEEYIDNREVPIPVGHETVYLCDLKNRLQDTPVIPIDNGDYIIRKSNGGAEYVKHVDNDTTYTFANGTNGFTVTPSGGSAQTVTVTPSIADATTSTHGLMSAADKTKLNGIATGAEVNQNAFSNVAVGSTTVAADAKTDTLTLEGSSNITLTPDATNDKVTFALNDTVNVGAVYATDTQVGDLVVSGAARFVNTINGDISGNAATADSATKATQDESGNNIKATYANSFSISDHTITLKNKNGISLGTVTVPDNNTTYTVATGTANGKIKVTPSSGSAYEVSVYGLKSAAFKDVTSTFSSTGTDPVNGTAVQAAIDGLPEPMVFKGSLGTGGTITALPVDGTASVGHTYKVITAGTYAGKTAKVGDTFICLTKTASANTWELIPSGDEPSGTVTSVAISNGGGLSVSGSPITSSGTITISHADTSSQASVDNSGRTYIQDITLDTYGHVTGISSATETVTNTDRYVNTAAFADDTTANASNPVKMTLTRAGSDTASVVANIPKVSASSAGVVPKGAAVSTQSQTTKFLREDGSWAAPSYTTSLAWGSITSTPTTIAGYNISDAKIASGVITLGSNTITPLTASSTLDATKLSGTIPTSCYTDTKNTAGSTDSSSKLFLVGATSQAANPQTYSQDTAYVGTDGHLYSNSKQVVNLSDSQALTNKTYNGYTLAAACAKAVVTSIDTSASLPTSNAVKTFVEGKGYVTTDTKNTAGSTDTSSKIYLVGATSQAANPQTYSDNEVFATSGVLTTKSVQIGGGNATMQYNTTTNSIDFIFA